MCLAYAKAEGSGLAMPRVHIAASTAGSCSRNGSKCVYQGEKLSPFPFVLHLSLAGEGGTARFQGNSFQCYLSNVWRYFLNFVASEEFNHCRLKYPLPCMGLASSD